MRVFGLLVVVVAALLLPAPAGASTGTAWTAADPYVDAIAPGNQVEVLNGGNLVGPPDGRFATVRGRFGQRLVLDLGAGEEGVGDLEVWFSNPAGTLSQTMDVHFLDQHGQDLGQGQLVMIGTGARTTTVDNPSTRPYRYLSILVGLRTADFDSMRAAGIASQVVDLVGNQLSI